MKNLKLLTIIMLFGAVETMHASVASTSATAVGAGQTVIVNKSDMIIRVAYSATNPSKQLNLSSNTRDNNHWSLPILPGATGSLSYDDQDTIAEVFIYYIPNAGTNTADPTVTDPTSLDPAINGIIRFFITTINKDCSLLVYGHKAFKPGVADTTVSASQVPSRYAAWWTGVIPNALTVTADTANVTGIVQFHMANVTGTNDAAASATVPGAF